MDFPTLQSHLVDEAARLKAAAARARPESRVPTCPDWTAADLLDHVTEVYDHKIQCIRLLHEPEEHEILHRTGSPTERFDASLSELLAEFDARRPEDLSYTWNGPDQSVGFWIRRMAAETVVHRADAELAAGLPIGPVDAGLGLDAADEMLTIMIEWGSKAFHQYLADDLKAAAGLVVGLDAGDRAWTVRVAPEGVTVADGVAPDASTVVTASPGDLLMWLWRRIGPDDVTVDGDRTDATALYELIANFSD